jgi:phosphatidylglycerophosphatase A
MFPDEESLATMRKLNFKDPSTWVATWGGLGFLSPAPGTWGTLGALPFAMIFYSIGNIFGVLLLLAGVIYYGLKAIEKFEAQTGTHDSKIIVIDEVAGMLVAILPAGMNPLLIFISFILFRFFDIVKPGPIGTIDEKMPGARGVMADDILAGVASAAITFVLYWVLYYAGLG